MNKFVKIAIILLLVILVVGGGIYLKKVSIGNYVSIEEVSINKVTVGNESIVIDGILNSSGKAYKDYKYELVGTELYVNIREVLVSNKYNSGAFKISIPVKGIDIQNIYLSNGHDTKVIYSKNVGKDIQN